MQHKLPVVCRLTPEQDCWKAERAMGAMRCNSPEVAVWAEVASYWRAIAGAPRLQLTLSEKLLYVNILSCGVREFPPEGLPPLQLLVVQLLVVCLCWRGGGYSQKEQMFLYS